MIPVEILEVIPTTHSGHVFEHYITGRLPSGQKVGLFDPDMLIQPFHKGTVIDIFIGLLVTDDRIRVLTGDEKPRIIPDEDAPTRAEGHTYIGQVESVSDVAERMADVRMNVGDGVVGFQISQDARNRISDATLVKVRATRSDVWKVG